MLKLDQSKKRAIFKIRKKIKVQKNGSFSLYPQSIFNQIKKNDILNVGFDNLKLKVLSNNKNISCNVISEGMLENNKGVHLENRKIKLNFLTPKDLKAIEIGKKFKIKNYALSFTNNVKDIEKFNKLLKTENKIFKIETSSAIKGFSKMLRKGNSFLIDRGDLSKEVKIEYIPVIQRKLFDIKNKIKNKKIYVATNLLESMIERSAPTRGEANDIYNSLEMGANGLVLAAETAVGKYPKNAVKFLIKIIKVFKKK